MCVSAVAVSANGPQLLEAFVPAGIVPVHVSVTVATPLGTVMLLAGGIEAFDAPARMR